MNAMHHPLACIHEDAIIGKNVTIEAFATIEKDVVIGDDCWIGTHATVMSGTRMGNSCRIFSGAIIGSIPQDLKYKGEQTFLLIGNNVTIREYCTINRGTDASMETTIGDNSLLMAYVHVAHDCHIGKNCILANNVTLAGHIDVGDYAVLGGMVACHQFVKIGEYSMAGGGTLIGKDIPPYIKVARYPAAYVGVNSIGMRRKGFSQQMINHILDIYRILFIRGNNTTQAVSMIETDIDVTEERDNILQFIRESKRGIVKGPRLNGHKSKDYSIEKNTDISD
jgi:UDP-N-acetylglucosamine acyltransferase